MSTRSLLSFALAALIASATPALADARLKDIACRSVHLGYTAEPATAFYNEVRVTDSDAGAYFMVAGWSGGYCGIQEQGGGNKVVIFSLWDSGHNDPKALAEDLRTKVIYNAPDVRVGRFGGEGTGGQSFFKYDWKKGETYRMIVQVRTGTDGRPQYSGFFYLPETKTWKHLVTFSSPAAPKQIKGPHSFVEDFRRSGKSKADPATWSTKFARRAEFGPAFVRTAKGEWKPVTEARFTADGNPALNIDAGLSDKRFFIATGGATENKGVKLRAQFSNPDAPATIPADAVEALKRFESDDVKPAAPAEPTKTAVTPATK
jgi:hypothetical protein